jgi:hypothetical protein
MLKAAVGTGGEMADTVLTVLVIIAGTAADLGLVHLFERVGPLRRKDWIRKAGMLMLLLGFFVALLAAIPYASYYICAHVAVPDDGYAAGWLVFFAGFVVLSLSSNRIKHRRDLKRLEAEDSTPASSSGTVRHTRKLS